MTLKIERLPKMLAKAKESQSKRLQSVLPNQVLFTDKHEMSCPICGSAMTRRLAKRGSNKGSYFWGCLSFPKCKGVRS